jgi:hypothetical protein
MKKMMSMLAAAAFAVLAGVNVYNAQATELAMSDLQMENVEALACKDCERSACPYKEYLDHCPLTDGCPCWHYGTLIGHFCCDCK